MACQLSPHTQCPNFTTDYHKKKKKKKKKKKNIYIYIERERESVGKNIYIYRKINNSHADQVQLQYGGFLFSAQLYVHLNLKIRIV